MMKGGRGGGEGGGEGGGSNRRAGPPKYWHQIGKQRGKMVVGYTHGEGSRGVVRGRLREEEGGRGGW